MNIRTIRRSTALRGALLIAVTVALAIPAAAQATTTSGTTKTPSIVASAQARAAVARLDHSAIAKIAKPLPEPANVPLRGKAAAQGPDGAPGLIPGTAAKPSALGAAPLSSGHSGAVFPGSNTSNPNRQIGKLYFWTGSYWAWCTATVINSPSKSMLLTAGHCVWNVAVGDWYSDWFFQPGYQYGASSLGTWTWSVASTTQSYHNYGASADDMAIVLVERNISGYAIADVTGAQGFSFNQLVKQYRRSFGYPITDSRWPGYVADGEDMRWCYGIDTYYSTGSFAGEMNLACQMTGGASGGPWLTNTNTATWTGYANSVNSNKAGIGSAYANYMFGPYFGTNEAAVYRTWKNG